MDFNFELYKHLLYLSDDLDSITTNAEEVLKNTDENGDPDHVPLIVKKMETLSAKKEELELEEVERRFAKINVHDQVTWYNNSWSTNETSYLGRNLIFYIYTRVKKITFFIAYCKLSKMTKKVQTLDIKV